MRTTMLLAVALVAMVLNAQADMQTTKTVIPNSGLGWEPAGTGAVNLTSKNFDQEVLESGKGAFVNFFAPWCEYCAELKPAWDKLGNEFQGSDIILVGEVDCAHADSKDLCQRYKVPGFPALRYFTNSTSAQGDDYNGVGLDFDDLSAWAKEKLSPSCGAENIDLCNDEQKQTIEENQALSLADLDKEIDAVEAELKAADAEFEELSKVLDASYDAGQEKNEKMEEDTSKLLILRSIKRARGKDVKEL